MGVYITGTGQVIGRVHEKTDACVEFGCPIHSPSNHHMKGWPTNWRSGGMFDIKPPHMERICKHGIGHPDPDSAAFMKRVHNLDVGVHGCCGCCREN